VIEKLYSFVYFQASELRNDLDLLALNCTERTQTC